MHFVHEISAILAVSCGSSWSVQQIFTFVLSLETYFTNNICCTHYNITYVHVPQFPLTSNISAIREKICALASSTCGFSYSYIKFVFVKTYALCICKRFLRLPVNIYIHFFQRWNFANIYDTLSRLKKTCCSRNF